VLGAATILTLRLMSRRWRGVEVEDDTDVPYGPSAGPELSEATP
jgi:hypothetical protein